VAERPRYDSKNPLPARLWGQRHVSSTQIVRLSKMIQQSPVRPFKRYAKAGDFRNGIDRRFWSSVQDRVLAASSGRSASSAGRPLVRVVALCGSDMCLCRAGLCLVADWGGKYFANTSQYFAISMYCPTRLHWAIWPPLNLLLKDLYHDRSLVCTKERL
jgi:hypothetical protein